MNCKILKLFLANSCKKSYFWQRVVKAIWGAPSTPPAINHQSVSLVAVLAAVQCGV